MANTITITLTDEETGDEVEHELPARMEVCPRCDGHGTHLNPSIGEHAYTREEFDETFDDEDREEYFRRGGKYDVQCLSCRGKNVVAVVDEERLDADQRVVWEAFGEQELERHAFDRVCAEEERRERAMMGEW